MHPVFDLLAAARGTTAAIGAAPVALLQEPLILPLQLVVEDDALDASASCMEPLGASHVRARKLGIVRELAALDDAGIERLRGPAIPRAMAHQQLPPAVG